MVGATAGRFLDVRPSLSRTRSSSSPMTREAAEEEAQPKHTATRPGHLRSRSYISPIEKTTSASTFPLSASSEKQSESSRFPRLHLPGKHHHTQSEDHKPAPTQKKHRYTQSDAQQHHRHHDETRHNDGGNSAGHENTNATHLPYPGSRGAMIPSLARMASYRSSTHTSDLAASGYAFNDSRLQQIDSNRALQSTTTQPPRKKTSLEKLLDRTAITPRPSTILPASTILSKSTLQTLSQSLTSARSELTARLTTTSRSASNLMRRLDEAHDTLRRTAESLSDTISSFSNLASQSSKLLHNFDTETAHLDQHLRSRINRFTHTVNVERTKRINDLESRGRNVSEKAEKLGQRLENCRTIIANWEKREQNKRKTWRGVRNGIFWGLVVILLAVMTGIMVSKGVEYSAGLQPGPMSFHVQDKEQHAVLGMKKVSTKNETQYVEDLKVANVPDEVIGVLRDIARRQKGEDGNDEANASSPVATSTAKRREGPTASTDTLDHRIRILDEL